jgi:pterin-4a-carbinolamine dehydratase
MNTMQNAVPAVPTPTAQQEAQLRPLVLEKLKAERVQEKLRSMPEWKLLPSGKALSRVRDFADSHTAGLYAGFVNEFAERQRQPLAVKLTGLRVSITLLPRPRRSGVTERMLHFAVALG